MASPPESIRKNKTASALYGRDQDPLHHNVDVICRGNPLGCPGAACRAPTYNDAIVISITRLFRHRNQAQLLQGAQAITPKPEFLDFAVL
jgi:hypothetical protein